MKRCEYCDTVNKDDVQVCTACGGNSFVWRCVNCGTEFKGGRVCPSCGVTVGQTEKRCPRCKATYYTLACPSCGYTPEWTAPQGNTPVPESPKKRHTVLWVLGWLFCFPIPLTVLVARSKKLPVWAKALIIITIWAFSLYIGYYKA